MLDLGGFTCCIGAAALYLLSRRSGRDAEILSSVTRVNNLKDLELLELGSKVWPLMIAVSGRVGSDTPIKCELSGVNGAIVKETVEQHFMKRNWTFSWVQANALMPSICKEVPWYLEDGTSRVNVVGAQGAKGLALTIGSEIFEKSERSFVRSVLDYIQGLKMIGVKHTERVLPLGMPLTVVGQAVKDVNGDLRIQKPETGPFYISPIPLAQLISNLGKWSRLFKYASAGLAVVGTFMVTKPVIEYILRRRRNRARSSRLGRQHERNSSDLTMIDHPDYRARPSRSEGQHEPNSSHRTMIHHLDYRTRSSRSEGQHEPNSSHLTMVDHPDYRPHPSRSEGQHERNSSHRTMIDRPDVSYDICVICLDQRRDTVFMLCGHMCCCQSCSSRVTRCPICRKDIDRIVRTYRS